jgi:3-methylfumaryl-CoA hydratase
VTDHRDERESKTMGNEDGRPAETSAFPEYVGRSESVSGRIAAAPVELLAALLNRRFDEISPDGALPPLWHWLILQKPVLQSEIGPDGHPERGGGLIPPIAYPRRMFAGSRIRFTAALHVGDEVERTTTIKSITPKPGRSGNLIFITLVQAIRGPGGLAVTEEQDLVYREVDGLRPVPRQSSADRGTPGGFTVVEKVHPDPVLLFRYSAAGGISHRIHYDLDYARTVEGYPNLIVHGPLQAIMLADLVTRRLRRPLMGFEFRLQKPVFVDAPFYCAAREENGKVLAQTLDAAHEVCLSAAAE